MRGKSKAVEGGRRFDVSDPRSTPPPRQDGGEGSRGSGDHQQPLYSCSPLLVLPVLVNPSQPLVYIHVNN